MGFRFRKSVKAGPFRLNFSKSGVGYSVGGKGFRYTKKAGGGSRTTTSVPGTGISYTKEHPDSMKKSKSTGKQSKKGCLWAIIGVLALLILIGSCGSSDTDTEGTTPLSTETIAVSEPVDQTTVPTAETTQPTEVATEETAETTQPTEATTEETTEPATEPTTQATTETAAKTYTYILNTNTYKFHEPSCSSVKKMKDANKQEFTGTREDVLAKGYSPCGNCKP